jgi:hypothetical protein
MAMRPRIRTLTGWSTGPEGPAEGVEQIREDRNGLASGGRPQQIADHVHDAPDPEADPSSLASERRSSLTLTRLRRSRCVPPTRRRQAIFRR